MQKRERHNFTIVLLLAFIFLAGTLFIWKTPQAQSPTGLQSAELTSHVTFLASAGKLFQTNLDKSFENATLNDTRYAHLNSTLLLFNPPENISEYNILAITPEQSLLVTFNIVTQSIQRETTNERNIAVDFNYCPITINDSSNLTASVSATASCVLFGADNITLDCNGYSITWDTGGGGNDFAVWSDNRSNVTLKNCILIDGNSGGSRGVGINFTRTNNSLALNNTVRTNGTTDNYGIAVQSSSNNNSVSNNTIKTLGTSSDNYGIYVLNTASRNLVKTNIIDTNGTNNDVGIYLATSITGNMLSDNVIRIYATGSSNHGILVSSSNLNNITNNSINTTGTSDNDGIFLSLSNSNNVSGNVVTGGGTTTTNYGIFVSSSPSNNITNNTISTQGTSSNYGIYLLSSNLNNISNNTVTTNGSTTNNYGIHLSIGRHNNITGNRINTKGTTDNHGLFLESLSYNNTVNTNVITTNGTNNNHGMRLKDTADNNTFHNNFITTLSNLSYGISLLSASDNRFNGTILNATTEWLHSGVGMLNNFSNTTFQTGNGSINSTPLWTLTGLQNITQLLLNITNNSAFVNSTNLTTINTTGQIVLSGITFTDPRPQSDFTDSGTFVDCNSPTCVEQSYSGGIFTFNVTRFTTYKAAETFICPTTITSNATLSENITATASCVLFGADNITLDCSGYAITWNTAGANNNFAVWSDNRTNVKVKNCILIDGNVGGARGIGINFTRTNSSLIFNNTVRTNGTNDNYGISIQTSAFNNTLENNSIWTNGTINNYGINIFAGAYNNTIKYNVIRTQGTGASNYGIFLFNIVSGNNLTGNTINTNGSSLNIGLRLDTTANNNNISNNTIQTQGTDNDNYGIYFTAVSGNDVSGNVVNTNGTFNNYGLFVDISANNNTIVENTVQTRGTEGLNHGIYLTTASGNNVTGNTITTNGTNNNQGILLEASSDNNTFNKNFVTTLSGLSYGVSLLDSSDNRFNGTTLNFTKEWIHSGTGMLNNFSNTTFQTGNGSINSTPLWTLTGLQNITQLRLNITNDSAFVNSSNLTFLNASARLTFSGLGFSSPQPIIDEEDDGIFVTCSSPTCVEIGYITDAQNPNTGGIYLFNVLHFTGYGVNDGPISGTGGGRGASAATATSAAAAGAGPKNRIVPYYRNVVRQPLDDCVIVDTLLSYTDAPSVPQGYTLIGKAPVLCTEASADLTLNLPEEYTDLQVLRCREGKCVNFTSTNISRDQPLCGNQTLQEVQERQQALMRPLIPFTVSVKPRNQTTLTSTNTAISLEGYKFTPSPARGTATLEILPLTLNDTINPSITLLSPLVNFSFTQKPSAITLNFTYPLVEDIEFDTISIGVLQKNQWQLLWGATVDKRARTVSLRLDNVSLYFENNSASFALFGSICDACAYGKLVQEYTDGTSRRAFILVPGLTAHTSKFSSLIDDFKLGHQPWQVWTYRYAYRKSIEENGHELSAFLEAHAHEYDEIMLLGHSLGGLIVEEAIVSGAESSATWVLKVRDALIMGTPHQGAPVKEVYDALFGNFFDFSTAIKLFDLNTQVVKDIENGKNTTLIPNVDYTVIAGTKSIPLTAPFFTTLNDGVVTTISAANTGERTFSNRCEDYYELNLTHLELDENPTSIRVIERIINRGISSTTPILGYNQYFRVAVDNCNVADSYFVIGKAISKNQTYDSLLCQCGNNVCNLGETLDNCPEDCSPTLQVPASCTITSGFSCIPMKRTIATGLIILLLSLLLTLLLSHQRIGKRKL